MRVASALAVRMACELRKYGYAMGTHALVTY